MGLFWKAAAAVLLTLILTQALGRQEKDISILLTITVCCLVGIGAVSYIEPVLDLLRELEDLGQLQGELLGSLVKAVGIALTAEIASLICSDGGSASLGKMLQMMAGAAVLYLSIPMFRTLMMLIQEILGRL